MRGWVCCDSVPNATYVLFDHAPECPFAVGGETLARWLDRGHSVQPVVGPVNRQHFARDFADELNRRQERRYGYDEVKEFFKWGFDSNYEPYENEEYLEIKGKRDAAREQKQRLPKWWIFLKKHGKPREVIDYTSEQKISYEGRNCFVRVGDSLVLRTDSSFPSLKIGFDAFKTEQEAWAEFRRRLATQMAEAERRRIAQETIGQKNVAAKILRLEEALARLKAPPLAENVGLAASLG